jgi:hypothetical protein
MSYRPPTDGYLTCYRCGADVVEGASFCAVCGAPQQVVAARPRSPYQEPAARPWWLPFAIIGGGIAALLAGVLVAVLLAGGREEVGDASPTPSQSTSAAASASTAPGGSAEPTPTAEPTADTAVIIPNLGIAAVAIDVVNLRSQPNDGASLIEALEADRRLFIIGEPTEAGDLRWYRVATLANETCLDQCDLVGYVATPIAADEEAWISQVTVDCPTSPMTHDALNALAPLEALHCYGNSEIVVTGTIDDVIGGYEAPIDYSPSWLAFPFAPPYFVAPDDSPHPPLGFHPHPDADLEPPEPGDEVRVTGHFEDPAATSCEAFVVPEYEGDATELLPNPVLLVLNCRATFAWTDYEVTGP